MSLIIRKAVAGDAGVILSFIRALADYEKLSHEVVADEAKIIETLFCAQPRAFCLIVEDAGDAVGFALYFFNYSTFLGRHGLYLEDLYVHEDQRGRGAGKALLARLAAIAKANSCERMEWSVLDWNEPSIGFYKSLGAEAMDEWTVYRVTGNALSALAEKDQMRP